LAARTPWPLSVSAADELAEIGRRTRNNLAASRQCALSAWDRQRSIDLRIEPVDVSAGVLLGAPMPTTDLPRALARVTHGRQLRQQSERVAVVTARARACRPMMYSIAAGTVLKIT